MRTDPAWRTLPYAAVAETTDALDRMAVDDKPSALTQPVVDQLPSAGTDSGSGPDSGSAPKGVSQPAADGGAQNSGLNAAQQNVLEALEEMDSRCGKLICATLLG